MPLKLELELDIIGAGRNLEDVIALANTLFNNGEPLALRWTESDL